MLSQGPPAAASAKMKSDLIAVIPNLRAFAVSLCGNPDRADDLVQETLVKAWSNLGSFVEGTNLPAWLFTILRNIYYSEYRKRRREVPDDTLGEQGDGAPPVDERLSREHDLSLLQQALRQLPEGKRDVLLLSRFQNLQYSEIGKLLGCEPGAVKLRVFRALKELRQVFGDLQKEKAYDVR